MADGKMQKAKLNGEIPFEIHFWQIPFAPPRRAFCHLPFEMPSSIAKTLPQR